MESAGYDWVLNLIESVHREVDARRVARGLAPYDWRGGPKRMTEGQQLREKYPFIVDLARHPFDKATMEQLKVEDVTIVAMKQICIKCGGNRHWMDTRGFCIKCKEQLGMPVYKKKNVTQLEEQRKWESKRAELAQIPGQVTVDADLIQFVWQSLPEPTRQMILYSVWAVLPLADKARYVQDVIKQQAESNKLKFAQPANGGVTQTGIIV